MSGVVLLLFIALPILAITVSFRLLARITAKKATKYDGKIDENQVKKERLFRD